MNYQKTKKCRLKTKYSNILFGDYGIIMSDLPTKMIVICNGGIGNGVTHDMILQTFGSFDNSVNAFMVPGKSYSFVKFETLTVAETVFAQLNDQILWPQIKGPVRLGYVKDFNTSVLQQQQNHQIIFNTPPGLILLNDFVTSEEEKIILDIVKLNIDTEKHSTKLKNRKVKHFGYEFKYSRNNVDLNDPIEAIPYALSFLWKRWKSLQCHIEWVPDQLTINFYEPGEGIPSHVDTHSAFEDGIVSLSLGSPIIMEFKNLNGVCYNVFLKRRSLCIMTGESRYNWTHGIASRKYDLIPNESGAFNIMNRRKRISLTFRKTRSGPCSCQYPKLCDSNPTNIQSSRSLLSDLKDLNLESKAAFELEKRNVHEVYNKIALHFSETRHKPWPNILQFVNSFDVGSILVDIGCGNGKYFTRQTNRFEIGCDSTWPLLKVCKEKGFECFSCNCLNLPLRNNIADGCICIAVIHHLTTEERRRRALDEMIRILRKGGKALVYVWAKNQEIEGEKKSSYLKQSRQIQSLLSQDCLVETINLNKLDRSLVLPVHNNRTNFNHNDLLVPWKLKTKKKSPEEAEIDSNVYLRFYHVYEDEELRDLCSQMKSVKILQYYYDQGNWCILLEKL